MKMMVFRAMLEETKYRKMKPVLPTATSIFLFFGVVAVVGGFFLSGRKGGRLVECNPMSHADGARPCANGLRRRVEIESINVTALYDCTDVSGDEISDAVKDACASLLVWPMPHRLHAGGVLTRSVASSVSFKLNGEASNSKILTEAVSRYADLMFPFGDSEGPEVDVIDTIEITVDDASDDYPHLATDVSYEVVIPATGSVSLTGKTVFGILHALETLSQLVQYDPGSVGYVVRSVPVVVKDKPRFQYRGLMVDCGRHFIPIPFLKRIIDTMATTKLNVLHLHLSDSESFPLQSKKYPALWNGGFSETERYTQSQMRSLVTYALFRGVVVMPEFDTPSHSKGMCSGAPHGVCMRSCVKSNYPLRLGDETFQFLEGLWSEVTQPVDDITGTIFPFEMVHSGGDEVKHQCWDDDLQSAQWLKDHNMTSKDAYLYFVNSNAEMISQLGRRPLAWNDAWYNFGTSLDPRFILVFWSNTDHGSYFKSALAAGRQIISASSNPLYYSNANEYTVKDSYEYDPCDCSNSANPDMCVNSTDQCSQVIGMSSAFWTEKYDASDLEVSLWPRALAMAERAWSPQELKHYTDDRTSRKPVTVASTARRLGIFRCHLFHRGIPVLPLSAPWDHNYGGNRAGKTGSCMYQ